MVDDVQSRACPLPPLRMRLSFLREILSKARAVRRAVGAIALAHFILLNSSNAQDLGVIGLYPPGAAPGESVEITCRGKAAVWPVDVWVDREGISGASLEEQGKIKLDLDQDATPGVYWIRLHSANHVSKLLPFYVDRLQSVVEQEPNNRISEATEIEIDSAAMGRLERTDDVDTFRIALEANEPMTAAVMGHRPLGSPMDAVIQICNDKGQVLDQNDDSRGVDPQLTFVAPQSGNYFIRLFAFPEVPTSSVRFAGGETFIYRMEVSNEDRFEFPLPFSNTLIHALESSDTETTNYYRDDQLGFVQAPTPSAFLGKDFSSLSGEAALEIPDARWGQILERDETDSFQLQLEKDQSVRVVVESRPFLLELDPLLVIRRADGSKAAENDDFDKQRLAQLDFKAPETETYQLEVSDASGRGGARFGYRVRVQSIEPSYEVFATNHFVQLSQGEAVEFVVNVTRLNGFDKPIKISAEGLAEGIVCEPVESQMGNDTEKKVALRLTATSDFAGHPIRIVAESAEGKPHLAHFLSGVGTSRHAVLWCLPKPTE